MRWLVLALAREVREDALVLLDVELSELEQREVRASPVEGRSESVENAGGSVENAVSLEEDGKVESAVPALPVAEGEELSLEEVDTGMEVRVTAGEPRCINQVCCVAIADAYTMLSKVSSEPRGQPGCDATVGCKTAEEAPACRLDTDKLKSGPEPVLPAEKQKFVDAQNQIDCRGDESTDCCNMFNDESLNIAWKETSCDGATGCNWIMKGTLYKGFIPGWTHVCSALDAPAETKSCYEGEINVPDLPENTPEKCCASFKKESTCKVVSGCRWKTKWLGFNECKPIKKGKVPSA